MTVSISPIYNEAQYFDNDGNPLSGGKIFQYEAGSFTVQQTTYSDISGNVANPNPIVLDSAGRQPTELYLTNGLAYNLVLTLADGTTILDYKDNVVGVPPTNNTIPSINVWNQVAEIPTYVSPTQFLIPGVNYTQQFAVSNRVRVTYGDTTNAYGTVTAVTFSGGNTNVTINMDGLPLLTDMANVAYSSLVSNAITVDSGAVSYKSNITYPGTTIGGKVNNVEVQFTAALNTLSTKVVRNATWVSADYTTPYDYIATYSPAASALGEPQVFVVIFIQGNGSNASTLNLNGLGAWPLRSYNSDGVLVDARITSFMTSQVVFSGNAYLVLDPLPQQISAAPRGQQIFTSNGTFTVPAGVSSIKVTCVGGGGQGQLGTGDYSNFPPSETWGSGGGGGATATKYISVTPGQTYAVSIGAGGNNGSLGVGGSTSFGITAVLANGGNNGAGGTVGVGDVILAGGDGTTSLNTTFGGGTQGGGQWSGGYGAGGLGVLGSSLGSVGGSGRSGLCIVEW